MSERMQKAYSNYQLQRKKNEYLYYCDDNRSVQNLDENAHFLHGFFYIFLLTFVHCFAAYFNNDQTPCCLFKFGFAVSNRKNS